MNLAQLKYFKTLAETKSFQETARIELVSIPALSLAISNLEKELGVPLFSRKKRLAELTQEGALYYEYVRASLNSLSKGEALLKENQTSHVPEITVGAIYSAQSQDWSEMIWRYRQAMKGNVKINVKQSDTKGVLRGLKNATIDVSFGGTLGHDPELAFVPCWTQEATLVVNKRNPLSAQKEVSLNDLSDKHLISYNLKGPLGPELTNLVGGYLLSIDYLYADEITLASIVAANPDIMAIACHSWLLSSYEKELKMLRIKEAPHTFRQLYMSYRCDIKQPEPVRTFIEIVTSFYPPRKK